MAALTRPFLMLPLLALLPLLAACEQPPPPPEPIRPVRVATAQPQPFESRSNYTGEVRARYETNLAFRIGGKLVARYVEIGSEVRKGTLLARLDAEDTRLAIENARAQVNAAQADMNQTQADLARYRRLYDTKVISQAEFDRREAVAQSAAAKLESARSQLRVSQNQMAYTDLAADADGVVTSLTAEAGQVVSAGQTVLRLARPEEKEVVFNVAENRLDELRNAGSIRVSLWAQQDVSVAATVREIAPGADPVTRTYAVKVSVPNPPPGMRLGMTASVEILRSDGGHVVALPLSALYQKQDAPAVWVFDAASGTVQSQPVEVATADGNEMVITAGLKPGMQVVATGVHVLSPGQKVSVYKPNMPPAQAGQAPAAMNSEAASAPAAAAAPAASR